MARIDNPFSLFEVDDDEVDPVALLARAEARKISEATEAPADQDQQQPQPEKKEDAGGRADRGRRGGRGVRGRGAGRAGGEEWSPYGDGYSRGYGGEFDGRGARGGRGGRGGPGRGRGRGYYEYRAAGYVNEREDQHGANRSQAHDVDVAVDVEGTEVPVVQGRGYYNRRSTAENNRFSDEKQSLVLGSRGYGGEGRRYGGPRGGPYERSENWNEHPPPEDSGEDKHQNDGNDSAGGSAAAREISEATEVPKDSEDEVVKNTDADKVNEPAAVEDASEKKNAEDDTMTLEEYEKLLFEKRKALEALKTEARKVDIDVDKSFGGMTLVEKKKEEDVFVKLKSDKDKLKKAILDKEEKARKAMSINEFLKPTEGEAYMGPSYARERAARIRSERRARDVEERRQNGVGGAEEGWFADGAAAAAPPGGGRYGGEFGRGRGGGRRGRGQRGGGGGYYHYDGGSRDPSNVGGRRGVTIPENEESLDKEFPVLGGAVKA